jgi:hypothetical protein
LLTGTLASHAGRHTRTTHHRRDPPLAASKANGYVHPRRGIVSQDLSALQESHSRRRHAGGAHRGPDKDLLAAAALILLFMFVFGGFFLAVVKTGGV